ncbi:MAG: HAD hydrolase-like protein [Candidatus Aenigmatarchaeota archaeon]
MIKAISFDLDGTLVYHKKEYIVEVVGKTILELGFQPDEKFSYEFWYGSNRSKIIQEKLGIEPMRFWKIFWEYDKPETRVKNTEVYEDVLALKSIYDRGIKLGIVTGALSNVAKLEISKINEKVRGIKFDSVITNKSGMKLKPYPDPLLKSLKELGVEKGELIYVGNGMEDAEAAKKAGIFPVIVLREENKWMNFDISVKLINSLYELEKML